MAYATLADLKLYLGIAGTADDELLEALLERATAFIEAETGNRFGAIAETRHFGPEHVAGTVLLLDEWLLTATAVVNGDGTSISSDAYVLLPRNAERHSAIRLVEDAWMCDEEHPIAVAGEWGWSRTPPADIMHATIRLAAYFYRQKDAQVFDVTAYPDAGALTVPQGIPRDVKIILERYRRAV